jgi:glycosyltransferase involved in cell wall biosynthesis
VTDIIEDRVNGIMCTPGDVRALAGALGELSADAGLRNRLVEQGYANAVNRFGTKRYVESVQKILSDVAGKSRLKRA